MSGHANPTPSTSTGKPDTTEDQEQVDCLYKPKLDEAAIASKAPPRQDGEDTNSTGASVVDKGMSYVTNTVLSHTQTSSPLGYYVRLQI